MLAEIDEGWLPAPSGGLFVRQAGELGDRVLLLHGLGGSSDHWNLTMHDLAHEYRVAAIDLRGHGRSDPGDSYSATDLAIDVEASLDGLGWPRCRIVGHDLGAVAALELVRRRPHRVEEVLLIDPPVAQRVDDGLIALKAAVMADPHRELELQYQLLLAGTSPEIRSSILQSLAETPAPVLSWGFDTLVSYDPKDGLEAARGRTVGILSPAAAAAVSWLDQIKVPAVHLQGEGHWPMLESFDELRAMLRVLLNA